jgi:hypothetical protein
MFTCQGFLSVYQSETVSAEIVYRAFLADEAVAAIRADDYLHLK